MSIDRLQEVPNSDWETLKLEVEKLSTERNLDFLNMVLTRDILKTITLKVKGSLKGGVNPVNGSPTSKMGK